MDLFLLEKEFPIVKKLKETQNVLWLNPNKRRVQESLFSLTDIQEAANRLERFAPYLQKLFPELTETRGIIESPLLPAKNMKKWLESTGKQTINGELWLKGDYSLPVSGSIKARGGIYEVLAYAEKIAIQQGYLKEKDHYSCFASPAFRQLFSLHRIVVGSTGNLGLSIGIISAKMGFQVTVHMSSDAKEWKKAKLREAGAVVVEHKADYGKAVAQGRAEASADPRAYFIDDENSHALFIGYAVAALRLKQQLKEACIPVDQEHPLYVYLPCGIGGGPGGVAFGLQLVFGEHVHCFFAEPQQSPCMLLGLATGLHDNISVYDIGLSNKTEADGLAVGRPSGFVGKVVEPFLSGSYTVSDDQLFVMLSALAETENIRLEPSALAGMIGPVILSKKSLLPNHPTHLVWATGGSMVPNDIMDEYHRKGKQILAECMNVY